MEITFAEEFKTLKIRGMFTIIYFITVRRRLVAAAAWIQPQIRPCVFVANRVALSQEFSEYFGFPLPILMHQILHVSHLPSGLLQWAIYGLRTKGHSLNAP
jgi:hypothetical protein